MVLTQNKEIVFCGKQSLLFYNNNNNSWEQRKVSEIADRYDNLRVPVTASERVPGSTPYYGANGIQDYVDGYTHDGEFVLIAEDGANDLKNYPVQYTTGKIWVNNHAHVLQGKEKITDNKFLGYSINATNIESLLVGGGRAKLNAEVLMGIELLMPSYLEQCRISEFLFDLDNLIILQQRERINIELEVHYVRSSKKHRFICRLLFTVGSRL